MRAFLLLFLLLASGAWAAPGDWYSCQGPVMAPEPAGPAMAGSLWRVVAPSGLLGRRSPAVSAPVVARFPTGTVLQADVGRGGADEVWINALDSAGQPWMRVRTREGRDLDCYVRANARYIRPVTR